MTSLLQRTKYCLLGVLLLAPVLATAQDSSGFSVSPTIFDMTANPGQRWETSIRLINPNPTDLQLYVEPVLFVPQEESGVPRFIPIDDATAEGTEFPEWIDVQSEITVEAERTVNLPITITVPNNADPGGHFAAVLIGTRPPVQSGATQIATAQVISTLLFLSVTGEITEVASIRSFRTTDYIASRPATTFELRIQNDGNVHLQPQGKITIYNMWGQERGEILINQNTMFGKVLPQSIRKFTFDWESDWSVADIGRYRAKAVFSYGNTVRHSLTSETAFWVLPWKWVLATIVSIALVVYTFFFLIKLYVRRVLYLSGFDSMRSYEESVTLTPKAKRLNLIAPLQTGMLDLRKEFTATESPTQKVIALVHFVRRYKMFFIALLAVIIVTWMLAWYAGGGLTERNYTVISETGVVQTQDSDVVPGQVSGGEERVLVNIINRTGSDTISELIGQIEELDYSTQLLGTEPKSSRTIIVFSPSLTDEALRLSGLFNNAPLSALPEEEGAEPEVTVLFGADVLAQ